MEPSFSAVWSRVTGSVQAEDELSALLRWSTEAAESARFFSTMSRRVGDPALRETLRKIARDEEQQFRQLSALYYLRTGDRLSTPSAESIPRRPLLESLRERYLQAQDRSLSYGRAAEGAQEDTSSLCLALSEEESRHARQLKTLVERLL